MADDGEWNRKGASLSDAAAQKEYGVTRAFIIAGINAGELEYREGSMWGNPYLTVLRSQLERYIAVLLTPDYLAKQQAAAELRALNKEISAAKKKLTVLEARKAELESRIGT
jgi:hypothetical protein